MSTWTNHGEIVMASKPEKTTKPPYVSFVTFTNALNRLRDIGVPSRVDASVFHGQSGSGIAALLGALRYLKFIDEAGNPDDSFRQFVDADDNDRAVILKAILLDRYDFITKANIDLKTASARQVEEAFRAQGIEGSTVTKSVSFFLAAANMAGLSTSPHVKAPKPPRTGVKRKRAEQHRTLPPPPAHTPKTSGTMLLDKFPDFDPSWNEDIQKAWFDSFGKLRDMLDK
jgi:hypothetical protein